MSRPVIHRGVISANGKAANLKPRTPFLLSLEGWYPQKCGDPFKLSCRYRDLLRCTVFNGHSEHFHSCFAPNSVHREQPFIRCEDDRWAIIYVPDKHGNFMGRAFIHQPYNWETSSYAERLIVDKIYGNGLNFEDIKESLFKFRGIECQYSRNDTYL